MSSSSKEVHSKEHKKRHEHHRDKGSSGAAAPVTQPPEPSIDGGFASRIQGVPGSTPGCTAGAYATPLEPDDLPSVSVKKCFPDHYALGRRWIADFRPKSLQLLLVKFGPAPSIADIMNQWLIRRVGRKCAEGTEEGRKDMAAFAVDAIKRLRKLPPCKVTLYRAVPWSAMGKSAPGEAEFCEDCNIVWPVFATLTKSEARARELLREEGGFLYVVEASQARDVTALAPVRSGEVEYMLEPNSEFTITLNERQDRVFVVGMRQNFPSTRPIMRDVELHKHRHRHVPSDAADATGTPTAHTLTQPPALPQQPLNPATAGTDTGLPRSPRPTAASVAGIGVITPTKWSTPSASPLPGSRASAAALPGLQFPSSPSTTGIASSSASAGSSSPSRFGSRLSMVSPRSTGRWAQRPVHRVQVTPQRSPMTITMWSAARAYVKVFSCRVRDQSKVLHPEKPAWARGVRTGTLTASELDTATESELDTESKSVVDDESTVSKDRRRRRRKGRSSRRTSSSGKKKGADELEDEAAEDEDDEDEPSYSDSSSTSDDEDDDGMWDAPDQAEEQQRSTAPARALNTAPGYGTMALYPNAAPTFIVDRRSRSCVVLGGNTPAAMLKAICDV